MNNQNFTAKEIEAVEKAAIELVLRDTKRLVGPFSKSEVMYIQKVSFKKGASFLAQLRAEEKPSEDLVRQIVNIFEFNQTESECPECDTYVPFKSLQKYDYESVAKEIASLIPKQDVNKELLEAAKELAFLHGCEQEGIGSGQPTPTQWMNAVDKLNNVIQSAEKQSAK